MSLKLDGLKFSEPNNASDSFPTIMHEMIALHNPIYLHCSESHLLRNCPNKLKSPKCLTVKTQTDVLLGKTTL